MKNKVKFEEYDGYTLGERRELTEKEKEAIQKESLKRIRQILDANGRSDVDERQFQIRLIKDRHNR